MNKLDLGWATGFFEGEGSFVIRNYTSKVTGKTLVAVHASLGNTDHSQVKRFHKIVGVGAVYAETHSDSSRKRRWVWATGKYADVVHVIHLLYDGLSERRKAKADEILAHKPFRRARVIGGRCSRGHKLTQSNIRMRTDNRYDPPREYIECKKCDRENELRRKARRVRKEPRK